MPTFCQPGEIARVTFPDNSVQDFTDTPVNIICNTEKSCASDPRDLIYRITVSYTSFAFTNRFIFRRRTDTAETPFFANALFPFEGISIEEVETGSWENATGTNDLPGNWTTYRISLNHGLNLPDCNINKVEYSITQLSNDFPVVTLVSVRNKITGELIDSPETQGYTETSVITITGSSGNELFSGAFDNCGYSVECIESCPPDTIDCGDCCLPCEDVLLKLCYIKSLFS
jgi:hypothetical protein